MQDRGVLIPGQYYRWWSRSRGWGTLLLLVAAVAAVATFVWWAGQPSAPTKLHPAQKRLADRFVDALVVRTDCAAAQSLTRPDSQWPEIPFPHDASSARCLTFSYYALNREHWDLIRDSGAIIPNCAFRGGFAARYLGPGESGVGGSHSADCVAYQLIARAEDRYNNSFIFWLGYLIVHPVERGGIWKIEGVEAYQRGAFAEGTCPAACRSLLARRALPEK